LTVSKEDVAAAYRFLLGREASDEEVTLWQGAPSVQHLRQTFMDSAEFQDHVAQRALAGSQSRMRTDVAPQAVEWQSDPATEARLLDYVAKTWTRLGEEEPHWSVLSSDDWKAANIGRHIDSFYSTGEIDTALIRGVLGRHGVKPEAVRRLLEYGCGVGRVTPHLAAMFHHVTAVDISRSHMAIAAEAVRKRELENVEFVLAAQPEFGMHQPFDLFFSWIVLQHNPPPVIALILRRMFACLAPGGTAIFQFPTYHPGYSFDVKKYLAAPKTGEIEVHCLPQHVVFDLAQKAGCVCLELMQDEGMGFPWISNIFVFRKPI
jgi:SAM-dependent methyltransferase